MAKRRILKKVVKYTSNTVANTIVWGSTLATEEQIPAYEQLFVDLLKLNQDIVCRISHTEPGNTKGFYKKLKADFNEGINAILVKLDELSSTKSEG